MKVGDMSLYQRGAPGGVSMMKFVFIYISIVCMGCSWSHPTGSTTANRRCNNFAQWDDCAEASNCMHARAWYTAGGEFRESWICVEKQTRRKFNE